MNDEALETYLNIIKTHSLTKTAENMFISQSAVSNRLISLEKELNVKLIDRSPGQKGVVLTQKGEEFVEDYLITPDSEYKDLFKADYSDYIERSIYPDLLKELLTSVYLYENEYLSLGRAYAREVKYIKFI